MNKLLKNILVVSLAMLIVAPSFAGNPDRRGEAGANELNMNGYARTAGLWGMNVASVRGLEAERINPAGLAFTKKIEIGVNYTNWLVGAGVNIVQAGAAFRLKSNAFALTVNSVNITPIDITTNASPEGNLGQFKPNYMNIGLSYAKNFSLGTNKVMGANLITGGATFRFISEGAQSISATGFGFDVGLLYTTGKKENIHFGVSLRNVGTPMHFSGDGFTISNAVSSGLYNLTFDKKSNKFELPVQLNIGLAYDIYMGAKVQLSPEKYTQFFRLTPMFQFESNAFGNDHYGLGAEFSIKEMFTLRAAYRMENGGFKNSTRLTVYPGLAAGLSVDVPFKKDRSGPSLGIDYGFRMASTSTSFGGGTHTVGLRINLGGPDKTKEIKTEADNLDTDVSAGSGNVISKTGSKKKGKAGKITVEDFEAKQAELDSIMKLNEALKLKAETPIYKIDTFVKVEKEIVIQKDTIMIPTVLEKSDYKGGDIDTVTKNGKKVLQFNDYEALNFETGSSKIAASSYTYLNYLVNIMKKNPGYKVKLDGHTDNMGDEAKNVKLSQDRVDVTKAYFVSKGIDANRISTEAFGSRKPKYENTTPAGRAKNRRVEIFMEM